MSNILFKKNLELLTHFDMYKSEHKRDWSSFLLHVVVFYHNLHISCMFCNLSFGTDTVNFSVSISTPKQVALVYGLTIF